MSTKIGHFEILSELAKSATGTVYKANDPQTNQTVALKAIQLSAFGDQAGELEKCLVAEAEKTKILSHSNLAPVFGAGEIEGQFCAAMEYIQGNSIATMLSRKEGFSIWDLLDIGRQVCSGLDHAHSHNVFHYSLEPAKIMCGWDGTIKVLGYGLSSVGRFTGQMADIPLILYYMSPEEVRGEEIDGRSNLFSLGAIFYEMVTDSKAFNGADAKTLRQSILDGALPAPALVNPKVHPGLSALIMKSLAKDPAQRYQSGRELLDDLENCKESKGQAAKQGPVKGTVVPDAVKAANQAKFAGAKPAAPAQAVSQSAAVSPQPTAKPMQGPVVPTKAISAAAGVKSSSSPKSTIANPFAGAPKAPASGPSMSSVVEEETASAPKVAVDPMMAEGGAAKAGAISFSEMTELPPLKESYAPSIPTAQSHLSSPEPLEVIELEQPTEKPKIQTREVAEKALKEIKSVPPRLMIYSIAGAAVIILIIAVVLVMHVNSLNNDGDSSPRPVPVEASQPAPQRPAVVQSQPAPVQAVVPPPEQEQPQPEVQEVEPVEPTRTARNVIAGARGKNSKKKGPAAPVAMVAPGQMAVDSTPQGAQVLIDGKSDPSWVTPLTLSGLTPGQHSITVSKSGFSSDTRTVDVTSGSKSFVQTHLSQLVATLAVTSTPAGASVYIDGKDTGKLTPAQVSVDKGQHIVLIRKSGYIDETTNAQFVLGQTISFSPSLRALGNVDDIKTVGKMKKLFGNKETAGMGTVSVKTNPKGAQIAVNQHMLEKDSPVDFMLDPGNYIIDITLTGFVPIHKVITVDKGGKAVIDEVLQRQ